MPARFATALYLLLLLLMLPACMMKRRYVVMQQPQFGAESVQAGVEVLGEVEGYANFGQILTLLSTGTNRGTKGTLLGAASEGVLENANEIPVIDPLLRRLVGIVMGTTRIEGSRRAALGRAIEQAEAMGADTIIAPRFEIETSTLTFFVPLGFLHSRGKVWVRAKAVRFATSEVQGGPARDAGAVGEPIGHASR